MLRFLTLFVCFLLFGLAPLVVQAGPPSSAKVLAAKTDGLAQLCTTRLHLDNTQAAMLRYYLQDQMHTLQMEVEGGTLSAQTMPAVGMQRLAEMAVKLLTPQQLVDFQQLLASSEAAPHLRGLALVSN